MADRSHSLAEANAAHAVPGAVSDALTSQLTALESATRRYESLFYPLTLMDNQLGAANALIADMRRASRGLYREWSVSVVDHLPDSHAVRRVMSDMQGHVEGGGRLTKFVRRLRTRRSGLNAALKLVDVFMESSSLGYELARVVRVAVRQSSHYHSQCLRILGGDNTGATRIAEEWRGEIVQVSSAFESDIHSQQSRIQSFSLYNQVLLSRRIDVLTLALAILTALGIIATLAVTFGR